MSKSSFASLSKGGEESADKTSYFSRFSIFSIFFGIIASVLVGVATQSLFLGLATLAGLASVVSVVLGSTSLILEALTEWIAENYPYPDDN